MESISPTEVTGQVRSHFVLIFANYCLVLSFCNTVSLSHIIVSPFHVCHSCADEIYARVELDRDRAERQRFANHKPCTGKRTIPIMEMFQDADGVAVGVHYSVSTCVLQKVNKQSTSKTICQYFNKTLSIQHPIIVIRFGCDTAIDFCRV